MHIPCAQLNWVELYSLVNFGLAKNHIISNRILDCPVVDTGDEGVPCALNKLVNETYALGSPQSTDF